MRKTLFNEGIYERLARTPEQSVDDAVGMILRDERLLGSIEQSGEPIILFNGTYGGHVIGIEMGIFPEHGLAIRKQLSGGLYVVAPVSISRNGISYVDYPQREFHVDKKGSVIEDSERVERLTEVHRVKSRRKLTRELSKETVDGTIDRNQLLTSGHDLLKTLDDRIRERI